MKPCRVTVFTSSGPLAKAFTLGTNGLEKSTSAQMVEGSFAVRSISDAHELVDLLSSIRTDQALCASLPIGGHVAGQVKTKKAMEAAR